MNESITIDGIDLATSHLNLSNLFTRRNKKIDRCEPLLIQELSEDQLRKEAYKCGINPNIESDLLRNLVKKYHEDGRINDEYKLKRGSHYNATNAAFGCLGCFGAVGWLLWLLN